MYWVLLRAPTSVSTSTRTGRWTRWRQSTMSCWTEKKDEAQHCGVFSAVRICRRRVYRVGAAADSDSDTVPVLARDLSPRPHVSACRSGGPAHASAHAHARAYAG